MRGYTHVVHDWWSMHTSVDRSTPRAHAIDRSRIGLELCLERHDASIERSHARVRRSTFDADADVADDDAYGSRARIADDAARTRIRRELAETWDVDGVVVGDGDGARRASALRAMAENMRAVLAHCASVDGDGGDGDGGDDERAQVRSLLMVAARDVVVAWWAWRARVSSRAPRGAR